jgi:alpha-soluble NSF attachment protein
MFAAVFGGNKYEDAAELLEKACNNYKLAKMWREAASAFELLADCHLKSDSKHDAASAMVDAANANKKVSVDAAIANLRRAVEFFNDMGRLSIAAKHLKDIGDISEKEGKMEVALQAYTEAGDLYAGEESSSTANACLLKVAEISATLGDHRAAVERFETVGKQSMGNNLLRFSVKGYLLNAGVCRLCYQTADEVKRALEKYDDIDPSFGTSRECVLLNALADAAELGDQDAFATALAEYDSMSRLDPWKTKLLLVAKQRIAQAEEDEDDLT